MKVNPSKLHVRSVIVPALFQTSHVKDEVLKEAKDGIRALDIMITEILDQGTSPLAIRFDDVADMVGATSKKLKHDIKAAMKVAHDRYDGTFDPPMVIDVEKELYLLAAIVIADEGRMSDDVVKYVVRTNMDEFFDLGAIDTAYDFACWAFLIDYFETCLENGRVSLTNYLKQHDSALVSARRLNSFIKKNWWYGDADEAGRLFMLNTEGPSLGSVINAMLENLETIKVNTEEANFDAFAGA